MCILSWFCSVMQAAFLFTVVGITGFLGVLAGQLPGVASSTFLCKSVYLFSVSGVWLSSNKKYISKTKEVALSLPKYIWSYAFVT